MILREKQNSIGRTGFVEVTYNISNQPINIIEWKTTSKLKKLSEDVITYAGGLATNVLSKTYLNDGSIVETLSTTPNYTGGIINNLTKTLS
jgi:hypothetical protein